MNEREFIETVLREIAPYVREKYNDRINIDVCNKENANDFLTAVDLTVQREIVSRIRAAFPEDAIVAEEDGLHLFPADSNTRCWVLDPIDGTANFVRSLFPHFGISLAFAEGNRPVAGGVALPITEDLFVAQRGGGAWRNGQRICVSAFDAPELMRAEVDFGGTNDRNNVVDRTLTFMKGIGQVRCHCAAVIGLCSVATGDLDAYVHVNLAPWDFAAAQIIVEEAGGIATRLDGTPLALFNGQDGGYLASNNRMHAELVRMLAVA